MKAEWERLGNAWRFTWLGNPYVMTLSRPSANTYGMYAEVNVDARANGTPGGHVHWSQLRISHTDDRDRFARYLTRRTGDERGTSAVDWHSMLEQACAITAREWRKGPAVVDLSTVTPPAQRPYAVTHLLPANETSLIYADGGSGKSLLGLLVATVFHAGLTLPGGIRAQQTGEVLYLDWETNEVTHARRLTALARGLGIPTPPIKYLRMSQPLVKSQASVLAEVDRLKARLLIIDSVGFAAGGDINDASTATDLYNVIREWNLTALALHHVNKAAAERSDGASKPYGAAYFWNGARNAWELRSTATEDSLRLSLWQRKDNDGGRLSRPLGLRFDFDNTGQRTVVLDHDISQDGELNAFGGAAHVLRGLLRYGARTVSDLVEESGLEKDTVKKTLARSSWFIRLSPGGPGRGREATWGLTQ